MTRPSDPAKEGPLLQKAVAGDRDALGQLLMLHRYSAQGWIYRFLERYGKEGDTEDVLQDTFAAIITYWDRYKSITPFGGLVHLFMKWRVLKFLKRSGLHTVPLEFHTGDGEEIEFGEPDLVSVHAWLHDQHVDDRPRGKRPPQDGNRTSHQVTCAFCGCMFETPHEFKRYCAERCQKKAEKKRYREARRASGKTA